MWPRPRGRARSALPSCAKSRATVACTNVQGPFIRVDYLLFPRLTLTAKNHFVSLIDRPAGQSNSTLNRFQFDAQLAF